MLAPLLLLEFVDFDGYKNYPKTKGWYTRIKQLPYLAEANKEGIEKLHEMYKNALKVQQN